MKKLFSPLNLVLALALTLFIIAAAVVVTLNFRPLYYLDVDLLNIPASSGLPKDEILANYNVLIDYNSLFGPQTLEFPTLAMSETGRIHFEEVKNVFVFFELLALVSGLLSAAGIVYRHFRKNPGYLLLTGILTVALPVVLGILIALNWQTVFVLFHRIVFNNDYWIFDAATDPVITILPDAFFMHCALLILALGLIAFVFDTFGGVLFAKVLNLFVRKKVNPMIGAAGISAFPMSARIIQKMGQKEDPQNFLLMHAVGANVSGQIASVIAGGIILNLIH
mgnify:CR=1 FL=1